MLEIVADGHSYRMGLVIFLVKQYFRQVGNLLDRHLILVYIEISESDVFVD
jgi:hypothetical protein